MAKKTNDSKGKARSPRFALNAGEDKIGESYQLLFGDCLERARELEDNSVDSIITDPPYSIEFLGLDWDKALPDKRYWAEFLRVAKPGAHMLVFGHPRMNHRLVCEIEDAGWIIRDTIYWVHAEGFPKALDLGKYSEKFHGYKTGLKPSVEPIVMAMKALDGDFSDNMGKWGVGGLNIDMCRIDTHGETVIINRLESWSGFGGLKQPNYKRTESSKGRYPANIIFDEETGNILDHQANITASRFFYQIKAKKRETENGLENLLPCVECGRLGTYKHEGDKNCQRNDHKTIKPLGLMRYLCMLTRPPDGGIVYDPFGGSGSTGVASLQAGRKFIGGEKDQHYFDIMYARLFHEQEVMDMLVGGDYTKRCYY